MWPDHEGRTVEILDAAAETTDETTLVVRLRHDSQFRKATIGRFRLKLSRAEGASAEANSPHGYIDGKKALAIGRQIDAMTKLSRRIAELLRI